MLRGRSGHGHRTSQIGFRLPQPGFRKDKSLMFSKSWAPGSRIRNLTPPSLVSSRCCRVTSGSSAAGSFTLRNPSPIPVRRNLLAWDCKVTPVYCACQEGNTIGCIPSNDGLDAGWRAGFPHVVPSCESRVPSCTHEQVISHEGSHSEFVHIRPSLEDETRTGWGDLRFGRAVFSRGMLP